MRDRSMCNFKCISWNNLKSSKSSLTARQQTNWKWPSPASAFWVFTNPHSLKPDSITHVFIKERKRERVRHRERLRVVWMANKKIKLQRPSQPWLSLSLRHAPVLSVWVGDKLFISVRYSHWIGKSLCESQNSSCSVFGWLACETKP